MSLVANHDDDHGYNHEDDEDDYVCYSTLNSTVEEATFTIPKSTYKHSTSTLVVRQIKFPN